MAAGDPSGRPATAATGGTARTRLATAVTGIAVLAALATAATAATSTPASARAAAPAGFAAVAPGSAAAPGAADPAAAGTAALSDRWDQTGQAAPARRLAELLGVEGSERGPRADRGTARTPLPAAHWIRPNTGVLTSPFGRRWGRLHAGIDLAAAYGSPIRAAADGVVVFAGPRGGYGKLIIVRHPGGITTRYGHMYKILVRSGPVRAGQVIALEGAEGDATGPHLHFEVRVHRPAGTPDRTSGADAISAGVHGVDVPIDPIPFLAAHGVVVRP